MTWQHDTMINPPIEVLLDRAGSKFRLVTLGAKRARGINSYFGQLHDQNPNEPVVPPQVTSTARKSLSIAFEEIAAGKIVPIEPSDEPEEGEAAEGESAGEAVLTAVEAPPADE